METSTSTIACAGLLWSVLGTSLQAGETGIASIHAWHTVGNKTCIANHWHYGSESGHAPREQAETAAILVWVNFTAIDYGTDWMSFARAESKGSKCERSGPTWSCVVEARACNLNKPAPAVGRKA